MQHSVAAANATQNTNIVTAAREAYDRIDFNNLSTEEKGFIEQIVLELEQAQMHSFSSKYRYIRVGEILNKAKKALDFDDAKQWTVFCKHLGLKERVEQRCRQIAKDKRFAKLTEQDAHKLHHLTQANMIDMIKEKDDTKFYEMLNNKDYDFSKPSPTEDEKEATIKKAFTEAKFDNLTLEQYKVYCVMTVPDLIKVLDATLAQSKENASAGLYPLADIDATADENTESEVA